MAAIKRGLLWGVALLVGVSGLGMLEACSSGDSAAPPPAAGAPAGTVYLADQDNAGVLELYRVASPGVSTKLNPALPAGRNVNSFLLTPDGTAVIYTADQDTDNVGELYRVAFANPGVSTKLNPALPAGRGGAFTLVLTPDGTAVIYTADQDNAGVLELYRVAFASPGVSTKLNPALPAGRNVNSFLLTPDGTAVIYRADQGTANVGELYRVAFTNPGVSTKLNPALPAGRNVNSFLLTPDGTAVIYRADQDTANVLELYRVAFANPGVSTKLNPALPAGRNGAFDAVLTPDGTAVIYGADQDTEGVIELYQVAFTSPGVSTKLNGPLVANGRVSGFCVNSQCR